MFAGMTPRRWHGTARTPPGIVAWKTSPPRASGREPPRDWPPPSPDRTARAGRLLFGSHCAPPALPSGGEPEPAAVAPPLDIAPKAAPAARMQSPRRTRRHAGKAPGSHCRPRRRLAGGRHTPRGKASPPWQAGRKVVVVLLLL